MTHSIKYLITGYYVTEMNGNKFVKGKKYPCAYFCDTEVELEMLRELLRKEHQNGHKTEINLTFTEIIKAK